MQRERTGSIEITVRLHGELRARYPDRAEISALVVPEGSTVQDVLHAIGDAHDTWLAAVNGEVAQRLRALAQGDRVDLFPALEGG